MSRRLHRGRADPPHTRRSSSCCVLLRHRTFQPGTYRRSSARRGSRWRSRAGMAGTASRRRCRGRIVQQHRRCTLWIEGQNKTLDCTERIPRHLVSLMKSPQDKARIARRRSTSLVRMAPCSRRPEGRCRLVQSRPTLSCIECRRQCSRRQQPSMLHSWSRSRLSVHLHRIRPARIELPRLSRELC